MVSRDGGRAINKVVLGKLRSLRWKLSKENLLGTVFFFVLLNRPRKWPKTRHFKINWLTTSKPVVQLQHNILFTQQKFEKPLSIFLKHI
jgi:hypothetical protein